MKFLVAFQFENPVYYVPWFINYKGVGGDDITVNRGFIRRKCDSYLHLENLPIILVLTYLLWVAVALCATNSVRPILITSVCFCALMASTIGPGSMPETLTEGRDR